MKKLVLAYLVVLTSTLALPSLAADSASKPEAETKAAIPENPALSSSADDGTATRRGCGPGEGQEGFCVDGHFRRPAMVCLWGGEPNDCADCWVFGC